MHAKAISSKYILDHFLSYPLISHPHASGGLLWNQQGEKCRKTLSIPFFHNILGSANFLVSINSGTLVKDSFNRHHCMPSGLQCDFCWQTAQRAVLPLKSPVVCTHKMEQVVYKLMDYFIWTFIEPFDSKFFCFSKAGLSNFPIPVFHPPPVLSIRSI